MVLLAQSPKIRLSVGDFYDYGDSHHMAVSDRLAMFLRKYKWAKSLQKANHVVSGGRGDSIFGLPHG